MLLSYALRTSSNRFIKRIIRPMMGFKAFHFATATIAGLEVTHVIQNGKFVAKYLRTFQRPRSPVLAARCARLTATVDLPTAPLALPTAMMCRTFGGACSFTAEA